MNVSSTTVILANGAFPVHEMPLTMLRQAGFIVCCDGAVEKLVAAGLEPGVIVGDLDSVSPELKQRYYDRLFHDTDQETNDLTKAVKWCVSQQRHSLTILGATGLREDHTIGNISLLSEYCSFVNVRMVTDYGIFEPVIASVIMDSFCGQQISLFSTGSSAVVTSSGLKYPLKRLALDNWWKGTLNEALGDSFSLDFTGGPLIVFRQFRS